MRLAGALRRAVSVFCRTSSCRRPRPQDAPLFQETPRWRRPTSAREARAKGRTAGGPFPLPVSAPHCRKLASTFAASQCVRARARPPQDEANSLTHASPRAACRRRRRVGMELQRPHAAPALPRRPGGHSRIRAVARAGRSLSERGASAGGPRCGTVASNGGHTTLSRPHPPVGWCVARRPRARGGLSGGGGAGALQVLLEPGGQQVCRDCDACEQADDAAAVLGAVQLGGGWGGAVEA